LGRHHMKCAECDSKECQTGKDCTKLRDSLFDFYSGEVLKSMRTSTAVEARYYGVKNRLEEVVLYASSMGYERLGIAFCLGLEVEARELQRVLKKHFEVHSVCCKVCGIGKKELGLEVLHNRDTEAMCNPIGQAMVLNREKTDLNLTVGLCVGHDALFIKHSEAPVSPFIVKDRVLGNNPAAALYSGYYKNRRENMEEMEKLDRSN